MAKPPSSSPVLYDVQSDSSTIELAKDGGYQLVMEGVEKVHWVSDDAKAEEGFYSAEKYSKNYDKYYGKDAEVNAYETLTLADGSKEDLKFTILGCKYKKKSNKLVYDIEPTNQKQADKITGIESEIHTESAVYATTPTRYRPQWMPDGRDKNLEGANLTGADLRGADLTEALMERADLTGADLSDAILSPAYMYKARVVGANFTRAKLARVGMDSAIANEAIFRGADLSGSILRSTELKKAQLQNANLTKAKLPMVKLMNADLRNADLSYAQLRMADLTGADLRGANLEGARMSRANLSGADLTGARNVDLIRVNPMWSDATCPDGSPCSEYFSRV